jgi:hypothetical protein
MQMVDAAGGEGRTAPNDAVNFVAFRQQQFREVGSVLSGDSVDKRDFTIRNQSPRTRRWESVSKCWVENS